MTVDLNADVGEGVGNDEGIFPFITSANIACGGHAGDDVSMAEAVERAVRFGVAIGAHPGLEDRKDFGRTEREIAPADAAAFVRRQVAALQKIAVSRGVRVRHVKPHGALYNMAARDRALADAIAHSIAALDKQLILFGLAGSQLIAAAEAAGLRSASEVFADRHYLATGALVPRSRGAEALIADPDAAAAQALRMVQESRVRAITGEDIPVRATTICLHGDSPQAPTLAQHLRKTFTTAGITVAAPQFA